MRDFFIRGFEVLVGVVVILMSIGVVVAAIAVGMGAATGVDGVPAGGGPLAGLLVLVLGAIYVIFVGGAMYLGLGIYRNTQRMADALDARGPIGAGRP